MNLFRDRALLKQVVFCLAVVTYLVSFIFFALGVHALAEGALGNAIVDFLLSFYFLFQVLLLFALTFIIERRRTKQPIAFADRRQEKAERAALRLPDGPKRAAR